MAKKKVKIISAPKMDNGGILPYHSPQDIQGNINPISQSFGKVVGKPHSKGGENILANGQEVEAEGDEPISQNSRGDVVFWGKLTNPLTGKLFKNDAKELAKEENSLAKQLNRGEDLMTDNEPEYINGLLPFNSGLVKRDAAHQKERELARKKELYGDAQQMILDYSEKEGIKPQDFQKAYQGKKVPKMKNGGTVKMANGGTSPSKDFLIATARLQAMEQGVDPNVIERLIQQESGFNPNAKSNKGALGVMQFMPSTAKQYGLTPAQLRSTKPEDVEAVISAGVKHFKELQDEFNGDPILAAASYNGGGGWSSSPTYQKGKDGPVATAAKYLGIPKEEMTGEKLMEYYADKRENRPSNQRSAFDNENYNYINNIFNLDDREFYGGDSNQGASSTYRDEYYSPIPVSPPSFAPGQPQGQDLIPTSQRPQGEIQANYTPDRNAHIPPNDFLTRNVTPAPQTQPEVQPIGSLADRNRLNPLDFLPEAAAILDRPDYVQGQQFTPQLYQPYQVSFQDRINQNQANFNQMLQLSDNPAAMATLAGQLYGANQQVLADEFRTNQGIANQVTNQNVGLLNQAQTQNLQLADQQFVRQSQAASNTRANRQNALASISAKQQQNRAQNNDIRLVENLFDFRPDDNLQVQYVGPEANFDSVTGAQLTPQDKEQIKLQQQQAKVEQEKIKMARQKQSALNFLSRNR